EAAADREVDRARARVEDRCVLCRDLGRRREPELVVEMLDPARRTSDRGAAAQRDRLVGEAERDVDEAFVLAVGDAFEAILDAVLDAADLAVDDAMPFAQDAA